MLLIIMYKMLLIVELPQPFSFLVILYVSSFISIDIVVKGMWYLFWSFGVGLMM